MALVRLITSHYPPVARAVAMLCRCAFLIVALAGVLGAPAARADVILTFDNTGTGPPENPTGTPYGTMTISRYLADPNRIEVSVDLTNTSLFKFHQSNSNHLMLAFNLPSLTLTGFTANNTTFTAGQITMLSPTTSSGITFVTSAGPAGYPSFGYGFSCGSPLCGAGFGGGYAGPLQFVITSGSAIAPTAITPSTSGASSYYAIVDLVNSGGLTGNIAATTRTVTNPEPGTMALTWMALLTVVGWRCHSRRRRS